MSADMEAIRTDTEYIETEVPLTDERYFEPGVMQRWLNTVVTIRRSRAANIQEGEQVEEAVKQKIADTIGKCKADFGRCGLIAEAPGAATGRADLATIRLRCPRALFEGNPLVENPAEEALGCETFHEIGIDTFADQVMTTLENYDAVVEAKRNADRDLQDFIRNF